MIIGIAGRKGSGKTTLAGNLTRQGFVKISFADYLKETTAQLYELDLSYMYCPFEKERPRSLKWDKHTRQKYSNIIDEQVPIVAEQNFCNIRQMLQYIGTDVLRHYDINFHVRKTKTILNKYPNCFVDDLRFPNEKSLIEQMGGTTIFLIRPAYWNYSNHASEISLTRHDFQNVILNDGSLKKLERSFDFFLRDFRTKRPTRPGYERPTKQQLLDLLERNDFQTSKAAHELHCSRDKIVWWSRIYSIDLSSRSYKINENCFSVATTESAYWAGVISADGCIKFSGRSKHAMVLELTSTDKILIQDFKKFASTDKPIYVTAASTKRPKVRYNLVLNSPFLVEDMKLWNIEPRKSRFNKIPDLIKHDDNLISQWVIGLIDGDGCIGTTKDNLSINILASSEIIDFILAWAGIRCGRHQEKNIENLFRLVYSGEHAVALYKKLYRGRGLERKWSKVQPFLSKQWMRRLKLNEIDAICFEYNHDKPIDYIIKEHEITASTLYRLLRNRNITLRKKRNLHIVEASTIE